VCFKTLRIFMDQFAREKHDHHDRDIAHEVLVPKKLEHLNVFGVDMTLRHPSCCLISSWTRNGDVFEFIKARPNSDGLALADT
jgi:hypothetical protein